MLKIHVAQHNPEIGGGKFKCERCGLYMTQKHSLERLIRKMHTEVDSEKKLMEANEFMQDIQVIGEGEVMNASLSVEDSEALELFEKLLNTE